MRRAIGRVHKRIQGAHPRRPKSNYSLLIEIGCDLLLAAAVAAVLGGLALLAWAMLTGFLPGMILSGLGLLVLGPVLLLVWERIAWEPFAERLSHLS